MKSTVIFVAIAITTGASSLATDSFEIVPLYISLSVLISFCPNTTKELGVITKYWIYICDSKARDIFLGFLYGYKMIFQIISLLLAFSIRKVKVRGLNDAKYIAAATYITSIVLAVIIVAVYSLKDTINGFAALFSFGIQLGTTVILTLVFVPLVSQYNSYAYAHTPVARSYLNQTLTQCA